MSKGSSRLGTNGGFMFRILLKSMDSKNFIGLHSSAPGRFVGDIVSRDSTIVIASSDKAS